MEPVDAALSAINEQNTDANIEMEMNYSREISTNDTQLSVSAESFSSCF